VAPTISYSAPYCPARDLAGDPAASAVNEAANTFRTQLNSFSMRNVPGLLVSLSGLSFPGNRL
jgi:hypothetical protein